MAEDLPIPAAEVSPRIAFMRGEGFILFTAVHDRVLSAMAQEPVEEINFDVAYVDNLDARRETVPSSSMALFSVVRELAQHSQVLNKAAFGPGGFYDTFWVREEDIKATRGEDLNIFESGFDDRHFPWFFSAALASASVHAFVRDERITEDEGAHLTLGDWANLFRSDWFSKLTHSLAFTGNFVYGAFGDTVDCYAKDSLEKTIRARIPRTGWSKDTDTLILTDRQLDSTDGTWHLTAHLHPKVRAQLRAKMHRRNSVGCLVARRSAHLPQGFIETNPHVREMISEGVLSVKPYQDGQSVQVEQQDTAIDRTLHLIADKLDGYDKAYGTPEVHRDITHGHIIGVSHAHLEPTKALQQAT